MAASLKLFPNVRMQETYDARQDCLPSVLEAGDDGTNEATLEGEMSVHDLDDGGIVPLFTWTPSGLIAMKL
jgi:hypothetical protein